MITSSNLMLFRPPYEQFARLHDELGPAKPGECLVWFLNPGPDLLGELIAVKTRPLGVSLIIVLPPASIITQVEHVLGEFALLRPQGVLPHGCMATPDGVRSVLRSVPRDLPGRIVGYLAGRGFIPSGAARREIRTILELSSEVSSVSALCRRMYTSRRTLGRHFEACGLPVPSHWLQFGRLMYVAAQLQATSSAVFRIAVSAGYPDGFTMSNQMQRMLGIRPSQIRGLLGLDWIIEAWVEYEQSQRRFQ